MANYYELVVFTAAEQEYADKVIDRIDPAKSIKHRLYRHHTTHLRNNYNERVYLVKDLEKLGRPLSRTVIIDNTKENYCW